MAFAHSEENSNFHNWKQPRSRVWVCVCRLPPKSRQHTMQQLLRADNSEAFPHPWPQIPLASCRADTLQRKTLLLTASLGSPSVTSFLQGATCLADATKCNYANEWQLFWEFNSQCTHAFTLLFTYSFQLEQYDNQTDAAAVKCPINANPMRGRSANVVSTIT